MKSLRSPVSLNFFHIFLLWLIASWQSLSYQIVGFLLYLVSVLHLPFFMYPYSSWFATCSIHLLPYVALKTASLHPFDDLHIFPLILGIFVTILLESNIHILDYHLVFFPICIFWLDFICYLSIFLHFTVHFKSNRNMIAVPWVLLLHIAYFIYQFFWTKQKVEVVVVCPRKSYPWHSVTVDYW